MPLANPGAHVKRLHQERMERPWYPEIQDDPELAAAYHSLQLHWLKSVPGYREALRAKLNEAAKQADKHARRIEQSQQTAYGQKLGSLLKTQEREDQLQRLVGY